jgi:hypothetical protein
VSVPTSKDPEPSKIDLWGFVLSTATMALLVFTIIEAPDVGWGSARSLASFAGSAILLAAFISWERRTPVPMLDVKLFSNLRFTAASGAVTVAFFSLFGFIFLMTQYFQFIQGFGPLSTGVHLLPVATAVAVGSVLGTKLAVRIGTKIMVAAGLFMVAGFYGWVASVIEPTTGYGVIAAQMVLYGLGMGITSSPATESIMGAVSTARAGVGSAINDATRLLGGTLGVAVIGSIYASLYSARLSMLFPSQVPKFLAGIAHQSVGAAMAVSNGISAAGHPALANAVHQAAASAFIHGISVGCLVAGGVALVGALFAAAVLPAQPPTAIDQGPVTADHTFEMAAALD